MWRSIKCTNPTQGTEAIRRLESHTVCNYKKNTTLCLAWCGVLKFPSLICLWPVALFSVCSLTGRCWEKAPDCVKFINFNQSLMWTSKLQFYPNIYNNRERKGSNWSFAYSRVASCTDSVPSAQIRWWLLFNLWLTLSDAALHQHFHTCHASAKERVKDSHSDNLIGGETGSGFLSEIPNAFFSL